MPIYKFKAKNFKGEEMEAEREAVDEFSLARDLKKEGYTVFDFEEKGKKKKKFGFGLSSISLGRVSLSEKMIFTRNLAVMLKAGLPVSKALGVLERQAKNKKFQQIIGDVLNDITKGENLSESMASHSGVFSKLYVSMVKAGEKGGNLAESLKLMAGQMEKDYALKRKVKGAMIYPAIVICAMVGIGILMLIYVVPTLISTFEELGVELPLSTRLIVWLSKSLITNSIFLLAAAVFLFLAVWLIGRRPAVRRIKEKLFLHIPVISGLIKKINSARAARTLSSLISSGVEIIESLDITKDVLQNSLYKDVLTDAKISIQKGEPVANAFKKEGSVFPPLLGEMMSVGEETGELSNMLLELAVFYEEEVGQATKDMAAIIEPVLMIIIGFFVGFFAISMIKPMYSMMEGL
ncbi:MAG: hypothetical protein COV00_02040 [Candidatus Tagabacteria bacterium CG10_big_fil_rev_8_21_14_0_10_40_13]|uniref:Type II secretion system protein GspF domain-containing protein n=1 Tax=Candidatus Tagabacteria bacterium CG10_big_fil_rev_8_21_14_0_10_40_13 TaxID=1975022 RepID=A0A2M8L8V9_9BACT|nr:MAG: hypothetical protein COV00_02040 [Candidatus Tagabacteria bacterium CG10_big_fil_rev_8_21_14_0_10_40_13]